MLWKTSGTSLQCAAFVGGKIALWEPISADSVNHMRQANTSLITLEGILIQVFLTTPLYREANIKKKDKDLRGHDINVGSRTLEV